MSHSQWAVVDSVGNVVNVIEASEVVVASMTDDFVYISTEGCIAAIGGHYLASTGTFIMERPYPSWVLNAERTEWAPPTPQPSDALHTIISPKGFTFVRDLWEWDEATMAWVRTDG